MFWKEQTTKIIVVWVIDDSRLAEHVSHNCKGSLDLSYFAVLFHHAIYGDKTACKLPPEISCEGNV